MIPKKIMIIFVTFTVVLVLSSGCTLLEEFELDPVIRRVTPYTNKIVVNDIPLRSYANSIITNCTTGDRECQINAIYRHVVENYNYITDPPGVELIQTPQETMQVKGGDCEDLSIFLNSLLENIGIKTYLVLTENHAYSLVYDVNLSTLWGHVEQSLITQVEEDWGDNITQEYDKTFILERFHNWYYGGNGSSLEDSDIAYMNISYDIQSTRPLHFYVVPSSSEFDSLNNGSPFFHYSAYEEENTVTIKGICPYLNKSGGVILCNNNRRDTTLTVHLTFYYHPSFYKLFKNKTITSYTINNKNCVVLDATAGRYGYPGYDAGLTGEKIAVDPVTKEYIYLT